MTMHYGIESRIKQPERQRKLFLTFKNKESKRFTKCFHGWSAHKTPPEYAASNTRIIEIEKQSVLFLCVLLPESNSTKFEFATFFELVDGLQKGEFSYFLCIEVIVNDESEEFLALSPIRQLLILKAVVLPPVFILRYAIHYKSSEFWENLVVDPDEASKLYIKEHVEDKFVLTRPRFYQVQLGLGYLELPQVEIPGQKLINTLLVSILDCYTDLFVWFVQKSTRLVRAAAIKLSGELFPTIE
uniref:Uncharacterized protein n=1 Tax=Glossina pallidipes TaxID=7398 RepID=A0A1A9ZB75_GLOPL